MPLKFELDSYPARTQIFGTFLSLLTMGEWVLTGNRVSTEAWVTRLERFAEQKRSKSARVLSARWKDPLHRQLRIGHVIQDAWDFLAESLTLLEQVSRVPTISEAESAHLIACLRDEMGIPKRDCSDREKRASFERTPSRVLAAVERQLGGFLHPSLPVPAFATPIVKGALAGIVRDHQHPGNFGVFAMVREVRGYVVPSDRQDLRSQIARDVLWLTGHLPQGCDRDDIIAQKDGVDCGYYFSAAEDAIYRLTHARELQKCEYQFYGHRMETGGGERAEPIRIYFPIEHGHAARVRHALLGGSTYELNRPGAWKGLMIATTGFFDADLELALATRESQSIQMIELLRSIGLLSTLYSHNDLEELDPRSPTARKEASKSGTSKNEPSKDELKTKYGWTRWELRRRRLLERRNTFRQMIAPGIAPAFRGILDLTPMAVTQADYEVTREKIREFIEDKVRGDSFGDPFKTTHEQIDDAADELASRFEKIILQQWYAIAPAQLILWVAAEAIDDPKNKRITDKLCELANILMEPIEPETNSDFAQKDIDSLGRVANRWKASLERSAQELAEY